MMTAAKSQPHFSSRGTDTVLIVDGNVLVRTQVAEYLRTCGFRVLEALNSDEALIVLQRSSETIRVVLSDAEQGFVLSRWLRAHSPQIRIVLIGSLERAAQAAAELCESGPMEKRPYDPQLLIQEIKASLAKAQEE
jgi:DNA-binding response OmpR family regulator